MSEHGDQTKDSAPETYSSAELAQELELEKKKSDGFVFPELLVQEGLTVPDTSAVPSETIKAENTWERPERFQTGVVIKALKADEIMLQRRWAEARSKAEAEYADLEAQAESEPLSPIYLPPIEESSVVSEAQAALVAGTIDQAQFRDQIWPEIEARFDAMRQLPVLNTQLNRHFDEKFLSGVEEEVDIYRIVKYADFLDRAGLDAERNNISSARKIADIVATKLAGTYDEAREGLSIILLEVTDKSGEVFYAINNGQHRIGAAIMMGRRTVMAEVEKYPKRLDINIRRMVNSDQASRQELLMDGGQDYDRLTRMVSL